MSLTRAGVNLLLLCLTSAAAWPQAAQRNTQPPPAPTKWKVIYITPPVKGLRNVTAAMIHSQAGSTIPLWHYTTTGYDGISYQGVMVGRSPFANGHRTTTVPTFIVPVIVTFQDTGEVFDPTATDACLGGLVAGSADSLLINSPMFQATDFLDFVINGVDVGSAQYLDAFQRGSFWTQVQGTPYHTVFTTTPTVLNPVNVTVPPANGSTVKAKSQGFCRDFGEMDINWFDNLVRTQILPALAAQGVGPANFPQLMFDSVVMYIGKPTACCVLGYHSFRNSNMQTYSVNGLDGSGEFGGGQVIIASGTLSHEVGEWMDDPLVNNAVPMWGAEGQVPAGHCQGNLEVGDPLSPNPTTPTSPFFKTSSSSFATYTLQELTFFSWFFGQSPSYGAGGGYSDNGTFAGFAKACPPGGTN